VARLSVAVVLPCDQRFLLELVEAFVVTVVVPTENVNAGHA
jgi:hypothetical protein